MDENEPLRDLVEEVLARLDAGEEDALGAACRDHPELADALRRRIGALGDLGFVAAAGPTTPPERIGEFTLLSRIGAGGMGVVYRAHQEPLGRSVALKLIRPDILHQPRARDRFARETAIVARLQHPGIVPIYTVGSDQDLPWYAMEHVPGCTLAEALEELAGRDPAELTGADLRAAVRKRSPEDTEPDLRAPLFGGTWEATCLSITRLVAEALEHAHGRGVLHRDVKPSNLMITPAGRVMLLDFGLSRTDGGDQVTRAGDHVGSLPYMAPELLRDGQGASDRRSDVYALGVTLYQLLTLRLPFEAASAPVVLAAILAGRPVRPRAHHRGLSWEAETVCLAAMDRDPERRYATAADLARDISNALLRRPVEARRAGPVLRLRRMLEQHPGAAAALVLAVLLPTVAALLLARETRRVGDALETAELQRARAEEGFAAALDAVDRMLTRVGNDELADVPGAQPVRRELLRDALELYEGFVAERGDDPELGKRVAEVLGKLAMIHSLLGQHEEAIAMQARALERYERLADSAASDPSVTGPERDDLDREIAHGHSEFGASYRALRRDDDAEAEFLDAIARFEVLVARRPDHGPYLLAYGGLLDRTSLFYGEKKRLEAEEYAQRAIAVLDPLAERDSPVGARSALGGALNNAAVLKLRAGRIEEALEPLSRSVALRQALTDEGSATRQDRYGLCLALMNLGILRAQLRPEGPTAEETLRDMLGVAQGLSADFPSVPEYRDLVARAWINLGNALDDAGAREGVEDAYAAGMSEARAAIAMAPESRIHRETLSLAYQNLFWHLRSLGRHAEIAARVHEVWEIAPDRAVPFRRVGTTALAYCAETVMDDASLTETDRFELREQYVERMVESFREMIKLGWHDAEYLEREWFASVRGHLAVTELIADLKR